MGRAVAVIALVAGAVAGPALADGHDGTWRACLAQADRLAAGGAKYGYAERHRAALDACLAHHQGGAAPQAHRQAAPQAAVPYVGCFPGAPRLYRGTLYCFD